MGFSEKAKEYFYEQKKLNNREIARSMDGYNEQLVSRYLNSDKISASFVLKVRAYFPDAPVDDWMKDDGVEVVKEPMTIYQVNPIKKINNIIKELEELKRSLSQK